MMKKIFFVYSCLFYLAFSCQEKPNVPEMNKASELLGRWENSTSDGLFSEIWHKENDSLMVAESYFAIENDTVFAEILRLEAHKNQLTLIVAMPNQEPVSFIMTSSENQKLVFENPNHDFPKKITYEIIHQDSLYAEISGDGKKQGFPFKRIP
jgi:hypothetical protein